mmetsp:Transcript_31766/g.80310  ORF Transcript_31766/g.80310 Transcript_31766/m.80310 type:complete len:250 (-) Transcript_31766:60-809(-)
MAAASAIVRAPGVGQCHRDVAARARSAPMAPRLAASRSVSLGRTAAAAIRRLPHRNAATAVAALRLPFPFGLGENQRKATELKERLLEAVEGTKYGANCSIGERKEMDAIVEGLAECKGSAAPTRGPLRGSWSLVYTTEKSVHSIANGLLLGLRVKSIRQTIDLSEPRVTNTVSLALGCMLEASGPGNIAGPQRLEYAFDGAALQVGGLRLRFQPRGGGWTEAVFCDDSVRVMRNSLGDTLIFTREAGR